jgi:hypothetical protein
MERALAGLKPCPNQAHSRLCHIFGSEHQVFWKPSPHYDGSGRAL